MNEFPTPLQLGAQLIIMVSKYSARFQARFAAVGKPLKYALMILGPDTYSPNADQRAVTLCRNPLDGYYWLPSGAPVSKDKSILLRPNGVVSCTQFFSGPTGAFASMKNALNAAVLPMPLMLLTDIETFGDVPSTVPYGVVAPNSPGAPLPGDGFVELGFQDTPTAMLTANDTVYAWLDKRRKKQDGSVLDPFNPLVRTLAPSGFSTDPVNVEAIMLGTGAVVANYATGLKQGIYDHFRAAFGTDKLCGEWNIHASTQDHQTQLYPLARSHFLGDDVAVTLQIPKNYSDTPLAQYNISPATYGRDLNWESIWNWLQVYQPPGFTPWGPAPGPPAQQPPDVSNPNFPTTAPPETTSEQVQRVVWRSQSERVRAAAKAAPGKPIMPSISIEFNQRLSEPPGTQDKRRRDATPWMVRYMLASCSAGARSFWLFAPNWNTGVAQDTDNAGVTYAAIPGQLIRDSNYTLVSTFNKRFKARVPRRNRMWRFTA